MAATHLAEQAQALANTPSELWPGGTRQDQEGAVVIYGADLITSVSYTEPSLLNLKSVRLILAGNGPTITALIQPDHGQIDAHNGPDIRQSSIMDSETAAQVFNFYASRYHGQQIRVKAPVKAEMPPDQTLATANELISALTRLANAPGPCFCSHGTGNPMPTDHTKLCQTARTALENAKTFLKERPRHL